MIVIGNNVLFGNLPNSPCTNHRISIPANRPDFIRIDAIFELKNLKKLRHSNFQEEKDIFFCINMELVLTLLNPIILFCVIHVIMLETIKRYLRSLTPKQYSTGNTFKKIIQKLLS